GKGKGSNPQSQTSEVFKTSEVSESGTGPFLITKHGSLITEQGPGPEEVAREIDLHAVVVGAEVKGQLPLAVVDAQDVRQVALDALLPNVLVERFEELLAAFGGEADGAGELAEDGAALE